MTGLDLPLLTLTLLIGAAFLAGWVDSIVGGGGLIQLPALLIGLPADASVSAIVGTNKVPSIMGTSFAAATYLRRIRIELRALVPLIVMSAAGSVLGAQLTTHLDRRLFTPLVLAAIVGIGWYTWRRPELGMKHNDRFRGWRAFMLLSVIGFVVGAWDGFIGPGTGSFFLILLVAVMGYEFLNATALAKLANLTTNLAAIVVFGLSGNILWGLGLVMGVANLLGAVLGATMALKNGNAFVRKVFLVVVVLLAARLTWDLVAAWTT